MIITPAATACSPAPIGCLYTRRYPPRPPSGVYTPAAGCGTSGVYTPAAKGGQSGGYSPAAVAANRVVIHPQQRGGKSGGIHLRREVSAEGTGRGGTETFLGWRCRHFGAKRGVLGEKRASPRVERKTFLFLQNTRYGIGLSFALPDAWVGDFCETWVKILRLQNVSKAVISTCTKQSFSRHEYPPSFRCFR